MSGWSEIDRAAIRAPSRLGRARRATTGRVNAEGPPVCALVAMIEAPESLSGRERCSCAWAREGAAPVIDDIQTNTPNWLLDAVLIEFFAAVEADLMR